MVNKKKKEVKEYKYILIINCQECGTIAETIGPCIKCGNLTFIRVYKAQEIKCYGSANKNNISPGIGIECCS